MKTNVTESSFVNAFESIRPGQFTRDALVAMFDEFEEMERDTGEEMEMDVIAICCEWSEYDNAQTAASEYSWEAPEMDEDEDGADYTARAEESAMDWLTDRTRVIDVDGGGVVILQF